MKSKKNFLQWAVVACLTALGAVIAYQNGVWTVLEDGDSTKLSFVILAIFGLASAWVGLLSWKADAHLELGYPPDSDARKAFVNAMESRFNDGSFAMETCTALGMLGTVLGIIFSMRGGGFSGLISGDAAAMGAVVDRLTQGFSTAYLTTATGLICAILLGIQYRLLTRAVEGAS